MLFCGVCGTDKHIIKGDVKGINLPRVLGHECVGELDGERYIWPAIIPCNKCVNCKNGRYNACIQNQVFGLTTKNRYAGGWATHSIIPKGTILVKVPDALKTRTAVLVETIASTKPLHNLDLEGKELLIIGSGAIGLVGAIHASSKNPGRISMVGHKEQASLLGSVIDKFYEKGANNEKLIDRFDFVYDAGGSPESYADASRYVKPNGVILESACMINKFTVDISGVINKEASIYTQLGYTPKDFDWAIQLALKKQKILGRIITHRFYLKDSDRALDVMLKQKYGKIIFDCK